VAQSVGPEVKPQYGRTDNKEKTTKYITHMHTLKPTDTYIISPLNTVLKRREGKRVVKDI
jgi:hypothetical protein